MAREISGGEGIACCLTFDVENFNAECHDDGLFCLINALLAFGVIVSEFCLCSIIVNLRDHLFNHLTNWMR